MIKKQDKLSKMQYNMYNGITRCNLIRQCIKIELLQFYFNYIGQKKLSNSKTMVSWLLIYSAHLVLLCTYSRYKMHYITSHMKWWIYTYIMYCKQHTRFQDVDIEGHNLQYQNTNNENVIEYSNLAMRESNKFTIRE